ncbi:MAG TPA: redoxin domain-containing protein [Pirellulales bacterium]|jgi:peroxiredoxin
MIAHWIRKLSSSMCLLGLALFANGCTKQPGDAVSAAIPAGLATDPANPVAVKNGNPPAAAAKAISFKDVVQTNAEVPPGLDGLVFLDTNGRRVALKSYFGKKNVVLVFTEGFSGALCPFCKTQTSRLIENYDKLQAMDTEVLVVYPGAREHVDEFIDAAKRTEKQQVDEVPFPIVLDEDMIAVDFFKIRSNLAHPSTYIIDKKGNIGLAYVGKDMSADRPSIKAIFTQIDAVNK